MTNNNQTYERPSLEVLLVEAEAGFATSTGGGKYGEAGAAGAQGDYIYGDEDF